MKKFKINNRQLIQAITGTIYAIHPYHKPENFYKIMNALLKFLDSKAEVHNGKKLTYIRLKY